MSSQRLRRLVVYSMWGALMFGSTFVMKFLPNIHLLALFIIMLTRVYRVGALIPIYVYVMLEGVYQGFHLWWAPYLYVWTVLWVFAMLIPRRLPERVATVVYCALGLVHGLCFGLLWMPFHMVAEGLSLQQGLLWTAGGIAFDITHGVGNLVSCTLCVPLIKLTERLEQR